MLVVAPKNVAEDTWTREAAKWDHLRRLRVSKVMGSAKQRTRALEAQADIYVTNRENLVWLVDYYLSARRPWPFDTVVLDELSSFKDPTSKRFRAMKRVLSSTLRVIGLTGTPIPNGYIDLWPQIYLLDRGERLGKRIGEFRERFFTPGRRRGHVVFDWRLRPGAKEQIDELLSDLCLTMKAEDWITLPPVIYRDYPVQMSAGERKVYDDFQAKCVLPLLNGSIAAPDDADAAVIGSSAAIVGNKLLQMACGDVYAESLGDGTKSVFHIHDRKLDALADIIEAANGEPVLVLYAYKPGAEAIKRRFDGVVHLGESELSTPEIIDRWNAGSIPILLCHPASAGHGLNLQYGSRNVVWFGLPWSLELYAQANARLHRRGQGRAVIVHHLLCEDTIDERVLRVLQQKNATQNELFAALRGYAERLKR